MKKNIRIIISGGGTGGHIFPAVSIANAIKEQHPEAEILFVGAEGRMEMQRVPAAGYQIIGLPVAGFDRKHLLKNISVLIKLMKSQIKARRIIKEFKPDAAVGVGGYASGPTLKVAGSMGIPTLIQEQNSYAGVTNKLLAKKACKICVAYEGMERFFDKEKIILTGNPVRQNLLNQQMSREDAIRSFNLDPTKKTVLIVGGSLGARTKSRPGRELSDAAHNRLHYRHGCRIQRRRFGHQPGRCRIYFRILSVRKACYLSSIAQCCRRSSDKECVGTGR